MTVGSTSRLGNKQKFSGRHLCKMAAKVAVAVVGTAAIAAGAYYAYTVFQKSASAVPYDMKAAAPATPSVVTPAKPPDATSEGSTAVAVTSVKPDISPAGEAVYQAALAFQPPSSGPLGRKLLEAIRADPDAAAIVATLKSQPASNPVQQMEAVGAKLLAHYGPKYGPVISLAVRTSIAEETQIANRPAQNVANNKIAPVSTPVLTQIVLQ